MTTPTPSRDELAARYLDAIPYDPYPLQEDALLAWFEAKQGLMVCAPTGTGKTLIAEAALFEALHSGRRAYYTTPLIALTEQKFREMQHRATDWGFMPDDVGLVTGNRRENPDAKILVVVAEILFNRLLHGEEFHFDDVSAVVMDEFHSFNDYERGVVWELSLALLPAHVRTLLLSATVGNAYEFCSWLRRTHNRSIELVQGDERKVPLTYEWVPDRLLTEHLEMMAKGGEGVRMTPALVFCFNREECWSVAETLKGKKVVDAAQQARLTDELAKHDWSGGAGPKLRAILQRGVGVHHAGVLPKYRRIVEDLFQRKLLSVATCTETLSAGINLPARSVVVPSLVKGPPGKRKLLDATTAHQIFGRAGRPQFDDRGFVYVLAHEDDVRIQRWKVEYDQIPEDTKDPGLLKQKKRLKKKQPTRRAGEQYWNREQFEKLCEASPAKLSSRGPLPWRLLAYMLDASPEVDRIRHLVGQRLMDPKKLEAGQRELDRMLITLHRAGFVRLEPEPPGAAGSASSSAAGSASASAPKPASESAEHKESRSSAPSALTLGQSKRTSDRIETSKILAAGGSPRSKDQATEPTGPPPYRPELAHATGNLGKLLLFRGINPIYAVFLINQLGIADRAERIQAMESVLELPGSVAHFVRVPRQHELPPGPLATTRLDEQLLRLGLATAEELVEQPRDEQDFRPQRTFDEEPVYVLPFAQKLRRLFDFEFPGVHDLRTTAVWAAGEVLEFGGNFNNYVTSKQLQKQEGMVFRHLLRLILLVAELVQLTPPETTDEAWRGEMEDITMRLSECCRAVDPTSTEHVLAQATGEENGADSD
ncbi:MAG TPA: DEAD/DEAH box helicase [Thermoguttaceae bacterium]|nr:DEAD/DEAH box helicase [Thermoguttaceae bacterium]